MKVDLLTDANGFWNYGSIADAPTVNKFILFSFLDRTSEYGDALYASIDS